MSLAPEVEVAVYLHNFHNLDLFQQGWYAVRVTCFWETERSVHRFGVPSRVLQYRVPEGDASSFWQIDDIDNSYRTRVFRVRYARQDNALTEMASFRLKAKDHALDAAVVRFELLYAGADQQLMVQTQPPEELHVVSSQSFRILASAWHGLHSYCAVTFDSLHMARLDATIHTIILSFNRKLHLSSRAADNVPMYGGDDSLRPAVILQPKEAVLAREVDEHIIQQSTADEEHQGVESIWSKQGGEIADPSPNEESAAAPRGSLLDAEATAPARSANGRHGSLPLPEAESGRKSAQSKPADVFSRGTAFEEAADGRKDQPDLGTEAVQFRLLLESYEALSQELSGLVAGTALGDVFSIPHSEPSAVAKRLANSYRSSTNLSLDPENLPAGSDASIWSSALSSSPRSSPLVSFHLSEGEGSPLPDDSPKARTVVAVTLEELLAEQQRLTSQLSTLWNLFLTFHRLHYDAICQLLRTRWLEAQATEAAIWVIGRELWMQEDDIFGHDGGDWVAKWRVPLANLSKKPQEEGPSYSAARASLYRKGLGQLKATTVPLQDLRLFGNPAAQPVIFADQHNAALKGQLPVASSPRSPSDQRTAGASPQDRTSIGTQASLGSGHAGLGTGHSREQHNTGRSGGKHVIFFVHGFQGHHLDLRLIRDHWLLLDPGAECVMSDANEDRTLDSLAEMGARLADEVASVLGSMFGQGRQHATKWSAGPLEKISFVGHSLGNLIIRAALIDDVLKPYLQHLHVFLSISAPHLGYLYSSNNMFNGGLWLLKQLNKGSAVMHELTFTDRPDMLDCYLYKLSQAKCWEYFKHVLLLSSPQDKYVPYHSARIELCPAAMRDTKRGALYASMVQGCLAPLLKAASHSDHSFIRADVNFDTSGQARSFSTYMGRTAHIDFLETDAYIRAILSYYWDCFK